MILLIFEENFNIEILSSCTSKKFFNKLFVQSSILVSYLPYEKVLIIIYFIFLSNKIRYIFHKLPKRIVKKNRSSFVKLIREQNTVHIE